MFKNLFGSKPWYQSLTAWGVILFSAGSLFVSQTCEIGLFHDELCASLTKGVQMTGGILTALGLRKAATTSNVS